MFRFIMPDRSIPAGERLSLLKQQMEDFLGQEALAELFSLLHTSHDRIAKDYNGRKRDGGRVLETQVMEPLQELSSLRQSLYPLFAKLGFFHINAPVKKSHSRLLILGGAVNVCFTRAHYASQWIDPSTLSVDGLSCYRPVNPKEREGSSFSSASETEFGVLTDAFSSAFELPEGGFSDSFEGDRNLNRISCIREYAERKRGCAFRVFAAPSTEPAVRRADTGDTFLFYLSETGLQTPDPSESLLAITSNRYCNRQFLQLAFCLLNEKLPLDLDVIGCIPDSQIVTAETYDPFQYLQDLIGILDWIARF